MKPGLLFQCLLIVEMTFPAAAANSIDIGGEPMQLGAARGPALSAMHENNHFLTTKTPDGRWVVSDRAAKRAVAILSFDSDDRLAQVEKNWTPGTQSSTEFAGALFQIVEQAQSATGSSCKLTASRRSLTGPNAGLRDPGKPDLSVRQLDLVCGGRNFHIYINEPTMASLATKEVFKIPNVLLYESFSRESISRPSARPSNRAEARSSTGSSSRAPERARSIPGSQGTKRLVRVGAVSN